jgi:hypothetical protein
LRSMAYNTARPTCISCLTPYFLMGARDPHGLSGLI